MSALFASSLFSQPVCSEIKELTASAFDLKKKQKVISEHSIQSQEDDNITLCNPNQIFLFSTVNVLFHCML